MLLNRFNNFIASFINSDAIYKLFKGKKNKDLFVFFVFLMVSAAFWFLNALRDDYITNLSFPVRYVNVPENEVVINSSEEHIRLQVKAKGYILLRQYLGSSLNPINYDVSQLRRITRNGTSRAFVLSRDQSNHILEQLFVGMDILEINPDTLFISLDKTVKRKVPIMLVHQIGYEKQFLLSGDIAMIPDSVSVTGPKSVMDSLSYIYTERLVLDRLRDTTQREISLAPIIGLRYQLPKTSVTIPVEPFSEKKLRIPLMVNGLPDSLRLKTFPSEIDITFITGLSKFDKIYESDFRVVVDATQVLGDERPQRLRVRIDKIPNNIQSVEYYPLFVEYLIERKR